MGMNIDTEKGIFCTAGELFALVQRKYSQPAWTTLAEIRDGTGFSTRGQSADAMAFSTWPSRGLRILGFEFKSHRSDWLRELKNPAKAEQFSSFCDEWWLATGSDGVAKLVEIPPSWGWAIGTNKGLVVVKEPLPRNGTEINRLFFMSIIRNISTSYVPASKLEELVNKKIDAVIAQTKESTKRDLEYATRELESLRKQKIDFEKASGIRINEWDDGKEIGEVVKLIRQSRLKYHVEDIRKASEECGRLLVTLQKLPIFKKEVEAA